MEKRMRENKHTKTHAKPAALWFSALIFVSGSARAQTALTLRDCLALGMQHNAVLQVSEISRNQADTRVSSAKAQLWPTVGVSGSYTHLGKVTSFSVPMGPNGQMLNVRFGTPEKVNVDAKIQMTLFTWGRISATIAMAEAGRSISGLQKKQERLNVIDQVLRSYYAVLLNREVIRVHDASMERAAKQAETAERRFKAGNASNLEKLRAELQLTSAKSALDEAKTNLSKSQLFLSKTIGLADTAFSVAGILQYEPFKAAETEWTAKALAERNELAMLEAQVDMQKQSIRIARSGDKPNVFAFSGYNVQNGFNPMEPEKFVENWNAGVQVSIPLFDGFYTKNKSQEAALELKKSALQREDLRQFIYMQVKQALLSLRGAEDKMASQAQNIAVSREALKTAGIQYENGVISSLDLTDIQQALTQSELLYTQAVFNHIMTKLDLCKASGDYRAFESLI
jgi:outer membrane protein